MAKLKNPLLSLGAVGRLAKDIVFARRRKVNIAETRPIPKDAKSLLQLDWRHMYQKAVLLWHALSASEKQEWESLARPKHMTGFAWFISQALKPNPGLYLPLQGGTMAGDIDMAKHRILKLPVPADPQEAARLADIAAATFLGLTDTPASYVGEGGKHVRVTPAENALQFVRNTFLALLDTPAAYAGQALKGVRVNAAQDALEFAAVVGGYTEGAIVYHSENQTIPDATATILAFNSEGYDTDTIHDLVTNNSRLTCKTAGKYLIWSNVRWGGSAAGSRNSEFLKNGARLTLFWSGILQSAAVIALPTLYVADLSVNDYIELQVYQDSGGNLDVHFSNLTRTVLGMQRIG